jgi:hypothetical protein
MLTVTLAAAAYAQIIGLLLTLIALGLDRLVGMSHLCHRDIWMVIRNTSRYLAELPQAWAR